MTRSLSPLWTEEGVLKGRPFGGVIVVWKKSTACKTKTLSFDEDRLIGLLIDDINLYFDSSCVSPVALGRQCPYVSDVFLSDSVIHDYYVNWVIIAGDFITDINKFQYQELGQLCNALDLVVSDVSLHPND